MILALLIGGSSVRGVPSNFVVQVAVLALAPALVDWRRPSGYWPVVSLLPLAVLALLLLQLLPLGGLLGSVGTVDPGISLPAPLALTVDWWRSAEALLFVLPLAVLFVALGRFTVNDFNRLLPFLYLGLLFNVVFGLVQFAARTGISPGYLPYQTAAGFFANQNHFATLMFVGIPLVIYQFVAVRRPMLSLVAVAVIVLASFATRSVAGAVLSIGAALVSYALVVPLRTRWRIALLGAAAAGAVALSFNPGNVLEFRADDPLDRLAIWRTTASAIPAYLPFGSGAGSFELVYPRFEAAADVRYAFINHAHNEYLELLLEGGLPAALLMAAGVVLIGWAMWRRPRTPLRWAAFCGLLFILAHSFVDYPLRTPALALIFVVLSAIVFSHHSEHKTSAQSPRQLS